MRTAHLGARLGTRLRRGAATPAQAPAKTYDHKMLERAEQTRASIFKQISGRLRRELPEMVDSLLRERLSGETEY